MQNSEKSSALNDSHYPWYDERNKYKTYAMVTSPEKISMSFDGRYVSMKFENVPHYQFPIVDLASNKGWYITTKNRLIFPECPSFSPDGNYVALTMRFPSYGGVSEIWILPLRGGNSKVIKWSPTRYGSSPSFSRAGDKLLYYRDIDGDSMIGAHGLREYRAASSFSIFETDLYTMIETRLSERVWNLSSHLRYSNTQGEVVHTALPQEVKINLSSGEKIYGEASSVSENDQGISFYLAGVKTRIGDGEVANLQDVAALPSAKQIEGYKIDYYFLDNSLNGKIFYVKTTTKVPNLKYETGPYYQEFCIWDGKEEFLVPFPIGTFGLGMGAISGDGQKVAIVNKHGLYDRPPIIHTWSKSEGVKLDVLKNITFDEKLFVATTNGGTDIR